MEIFDQEERAVVQKAVTSMYFLSGQIEQANHKFATAFHTLELARRYKAAAIKHERAGRNYYWFSVVWFVLSLVIWALA
jgi:hypothetical protein